MNVCLVGEVVCEFMCITQAKLRSMAYWYGWFVKVQLDIFETCRFMMANVGLLLKRWVSYSSLMKGRVITYTKTVTTIVSIKQMNYYRN